MAPAKVGAILQPISGKLFARITIWLYRLLALLGVVMFIGATTTLFITHECVFLDGCFISVFAFFVVSDMAPGCAAISTGIYLNSSTLFKTA